LIVIDLQEGIVNGNFIHPIGEVIGLGETGSTQEIISLLEKRSSAS
jgi:hypothetical protein